jgi:hypothetical protein
MRARKKYPPLCRIVIFKRFLNLDRMYRWGPKGALQAVLREAALCVALLALVWRVVLPSGPFLSVDTQGKLVELCALTGLVLEKSDNKDGAPTKALDHCPLAMAGAIGTPPPVIAVSPPQIIGAVEATQFTQRILDNAPFRASPPRGPPTHQA